MYETTSQDEMPPTVRLRAPQRFQVAPPPSGAVIEWTNEGTVDAVVTLPSGERLQVACYENAVVEIDGPESQILYACVRHGAVWIPSSALARLARAELASSAVMGETWAGLAHMSVS